LSGLTAGQVIYAASASTVTDSANLTFDGTTLYPQRVAIGPGATTTMNGQFVASTGQIATAGDAQHGEIVCQGQSVNAAIVYLAPGLPISAETTSTISIFIHLVGRIIGTSNIGYYHGYGCANAHILNGVVTLAVPVWVYTSYNSVNYNVLGLVNNSSVLQLSVGGVSTYTVNWVAHFSYVKVKG
jgi:hypothetical protein